MGFSQKERSDPPPYRCATQTDLSYSLIDSELQVFTRGMVKNNVYVYMEHLRALDSFRQAADLSHLIITQEVHSYPSQPKRLGLRAIRSP